MASIRTVLLMIAAFFLISCSSSKEENPLIEITIKPTKPYLLMGETYSCDAMMTAASERERDVTGPYARFNVTIKNISGKTLEFQFAKAKFKSSALSGELSIDFGLPTDSAGKTVAPTYNPGDSTVDPPTSGTENLFLGGSFAETGSSARTVAGCWPLITGFSFADPKRQAVVSGKWRFYFTITKDENGNDVEEPYSVDAESSVRYMGDDF